MFDPCTDAFQLPSFIAGYLVAGRPAASLNPLTKEMEEGLLLFSFLLRLTF
jgi:hypothetical protein